MCVAIPGLVKKVKDNKAVIDFNGNEVEAFIGLVDVEAGDYALVHAGCVIQKMQEKEAKEIIDIFNEMEPN